MITSISANNSPQAEGVAQPTATPAQTAAPIAGLSHAPVPQQGDQVKLSLSAQILALYHQEMSPSQIAANLGMPVQQVTSYLPGVTPTTPAATPAPATASSSASAIPAFTPATASTSVSTAAPASAQSAPAAPATAQN